MITREAIVATAGAWIGTPYHHQACVKGRGCDCLGLSTTLSALGLWATGDTTLMELVGKLPLLLGGLGLAALGAKVDDTAGPARSAKSPKK